MAPTALDPLGNLPEKNSERRGRKACQHVHTAEQQHGKSHLHWMYLYVSVWCSSVDALWQDLKEPILVQILDRMWKEVKKHMTAAAGWSFLVHAYMVTLWLYTQWIYSIHNQWMYSFINMCKCPYTVVSLCNQCLNGWLEEKLIDPLSAALALRSVILCSQTAQQSITWDIWEKREGKKDIDTGQLFLWWCFRVLPSIYMRIMCEWPPIKPGEFSFWE